jgi:hypothetical protein
VIFYRGPSVLDGSPIIGIATFQSMNRKTADVVSTWILPDRVDVVAAATNGADSGICGDCKHRVRGDAPVVRGARKAPTVRGITFLLTRAPRKVHLHVKRARTCYVNVGQGPRSIADGVRRGIYPLFHEWEHSRFVAGRVLRLGAYGDPAAIPPAAWAPLLEIARVERLGYTHQWARPHGAWLRPFAMASVDSDAEADAARAAGWITFRVRRGDAPVRRGELVCPASREAGFRLTCSDCGACRGAGFGPARAFVGVVIIAHGSGSGGFSV